MDTGFVWEAKMATSSFGMLAKQAPIILRMQSRRLMSSSTLSWFQNLIKNNILRASLSFRPNRRAIHAIL
tara:strand:+ start:488 stop:697 length:210 start_codon:yes stop_codon:yes gene_type:complete